MSNVIYNNLLTKLNNARPARKLTMAQENGFDTVEAYRAYLTNAIANLSAGTVITGTIEIPVVHIVDIVDRSGSMNGSKIAAAATGMVNGLEDFNSNPEVKNTYTNVWFSTKREYVAERVTTIDNKLINKVGVHSTYGSTDLYRTLIHVLNKMDKDTPKSEKVLVNVYTDGEDTDGGVRAREQAQALIAKLGAENFTITFVGTERDVKYVQNHLSIHASNTCVYDGTGAGLTKSMEATRGGRQQYMKSVAAGQDVSLGFYKNVN